MSGNLLGLAYGSSSEDEEPEEAVKPESEPKDLEGTDFPGVAKVVSVVGLPRLDYRKLITALGYVSSRIRG